jgi:transcriptional regulator with XRE-family HTH domain
MKLNTDKLKEARRAKRLTQKMVADAAGIDLVQYQMWETGKRNPKYENLQKIVAVLGKDIAIGEPEPINEAVENELRAIIEVQNRYLIKLISETQKISIQAAAKLLNDDISVELAKIG